MDVTQRGAPRVGVAIAALALVVASAGLYVWSASLSFWPGPGQSPTLDQGLLISNLTSVALIVVAALVATLGRAVPLGIAIGVVALVLLLFRGLLPIVLPAGVVAVVIVGVVSIVKARRA